jgi:predicted RecB family nuclease
VASPGLTREGGFGRVAAIFQAFGHRRSALRSGKPFIFRVFGVFGGLTYLFLGKQEQPCPRGEMSCVEAQIGEYVPPMRITSPIFDAFLKCATKCHLRSLGEIGSGNEYAEWVRGQDESYAREAARALQEGVPETERVGAPPATENLKVAKWRLAVDLLAQTPDKFMDSSLGADAMLTDETHPSPCPLPAMRGEGGRRPGEGTDARKPSPNEEARVLGGPGSEQLLECRLHAVERVPSEGRGKPAQFIPIRFVFRNKLTKDDRLVLALDALALSQVLRREVSLGKIIHGDDHATLKVKTSALTAEVRKRVEKLAALLSSPAPPDLVLNQHCAECEFQARCRQKALEKDDLSLLAGMAEKERKKFRSEGIFTITQLSYTFRPRRRPKHLRDKREKYHHSLKALAVREHKIHLVGSPRLKIDGTPVVLDVESVPDRDFYYLIGVRVLNGDFCERYSFWADTQHEERRIWAEFLRVIDRLNSPVLLHYGSFETAFLQRMRDRYLPTAQHIALVERLAGEAVNVVAFIYGQVYFPTLSNNLKEVATFLGFSWPDPAGTGAYSVMWRHQWETSMASEIKNKLLAYNQADCEALEVLVKTLCRLPSGKEAGEEGDEGTIAFVTAHLSNRFSRSDWRTFEGAIPELDRINEAAQWDYQRDRVYIRTQKPLRRKGRIARARKGTGYVAKKTVSATRHPICPKCLRKSRGKARQHSIVVHDLLFGRSLVKRRNVKRDFRLFWCKKCKTAFSEDARFHQRHRFGWNLLALYFYLAIELNFPQRPIAKLFERLFDVCISTGTGSGFKQRFSAYYEETRQKLLNKITSGHLVHVDETKARIGGGAGYVWVFTSMVEVVYLYSESREAQVLMSILRDFKGVVVSDFYAAYDSLECPQQKCLIHLMRDFNDAIMAHPYDEELKQITRDFGLLLRPIIETIDRYGLKNHFLKKYLKSVKRFYQKLSSTEYQSEAALKCKLRLEKNQNKLFTFLCYDGVPWNNNNAEHAVKAYARLREIAAGDLTPKAISEYLILLSVCETCRYMGLDFLDFLRSGEKDIHAFAESRRGRRRRTQTSQTDGLPPDVNPDTGN